MEIKKGDKVKIVPKDSHLGNVKALYGQELTVKEVVKSKKTRQVFYRLEEIQFLANENDITLCSEEKK